MRVACFCGYTYTAVSQEDSCCPSCGYDPMENVLVTTGNGVLVTHTREEWERFKAGVDMESSFKMGQEI